MIIKGEHLVPEVDPADVEGIYISGNDVKGIGTSLSLKRALGALARAFSPDSGYAGKINLGVLAEATPEELAAVRQVGPKGVTAVANYIKEVARKQ